MKDKTTALISGIEHFDLTHTFMCGQCFRWYENQDKTYTGIAYGKAVTFGFENGELTIFNTTEEDVKNIWIDYLDLNRDYSEIKNMYLADRFVAKAMEFGYGIHILNQEIFECLISFIISTQNQIPRIKKIVASLSEMYGNPCKIGDKTLYAFPTAEELKKSFDEELMMLLEEEYTEFLGNKVVCHSIPIRPGRNLAIICESAAINYRQKKMGYNAAQELYKRVQENLAKGRR